CVLHSSPSCCSAVAHRALPSFPTRRSSDLAGLSAGPSRTSTRSCGEPCFHCKKASVHRKTPTNSPVCAILKKGRLSKRKQKAQNAKLPLDTGGVALYCFIEESGAPAPPAVKNEQEVLKMTKFAKRFLSAAAAACLLCGCILPASAAETEEEARVLQYETAQPVSAVVVDTRWTEVVIQPGQTDKITVESAADAKGEYSYDCTVADGVLKVNVEGIEGEEFRDYIQIGPFRFLNQYAITLDNTITVTLPNKMYDSIQVKADHDDIRMRDIQSQTA